MAVSAIACLAFVLLLASHPAAAHSTRSAAPPAQLARSVFHDDDAPPAPTAPYNYTCSGACSRPVRSCTKASPCAGGTVLMGGGPDVADAFAWQVQQGRGGDFLVLRADGTGAYNDWVMQVTKANSAATFVLNEASSWSDPFVLSKIGGADAIFFAGGNQWNYTQWEGSPLQAAVNEAVNERGVPVGGTSAGCSIQGNFVYTAKHDTIYPHDALQNPYNFRITLGGAWFNERTQHGSPLRNVVTDPHFVTRGRMGRLVTFMARLLQDGNATGAVHGVGIDEQTALLVDVNGETNVVGDGTAYFASAAAPPSVCREKTPLSFGPLQMLRVAKGDAFNMTAWKPLHGGTGYALSVRRGAFQQAPYGPHGPKPGNDDDDYYMG